MPVGQAQGTKITWDDATDKKLLMAMLKVASPTVPSFQEVAQVFGEGATAKALTHRWAKLKKQIDDGNDAPAVKAPAKSKAAKGARGASGSKAGSKRGIKEASAAAGEEDDDEEEAQVKETKKIKLEHQIPEQDGQED